MEGYHPHLRHVFDRLRDEHRTIAAVQSALAELLAGVGIAEPDRFRGELSRMTEQLTAHLELRGGRESCLCWRGCPGRRGLENRSAQPLGMSFFDSR
ncbi:hypothetical protein SMICM304S_10433 [Streptomyces microflavus]